MVMADGFAWNGQTYASLSTPANPRSKQISFSVSGFLWRRLHALTIGEPAESQQLFA
jgi:hypothetical protein